MSDTPLTEQFDSVEAVLESIARGEIVIVVDDAERENEGDLIMAASHAKPEQVAFMIRHTSGILCTPLGEEDARRFRLDPMVARNDAPMSTAFTISIDYRHGLTTGISAEERANTVVALTNSNTSPDDFVRPGHIFPLIAKQGGVLVRSGHTEAGVDLARLAGQPPVALLAEVVHDDGTVMRLPALREFARQHALRMVSIAQIIEYRQRREQLVTRVREFPIKTHLGPARAYTYRTEFEDAEHLVVVLGHIDTNEPVPVRMHREKLLDDVFGSQTHHEHNMLRTSLERIQSFGGGVLIYLRTGFVGVPIEPLRAEQDEFEDAESQRKRGWLEVGVGAQILRDIGVSRIRLITGRPSDHYVGLEGFGLHLEAIEVLGP